MYQYVQTTDGKTVKTYCSLSDMNLADCVLYAKERHNAQLFARNVQEARQMIRRLEAGHFVPFVKAVWMLCKTDTQGDEPNYSEVYRAVIPYFEGESQSSIMRRAKVAVNMNGDVGRTHDFGDGLEFWSNRNPVMLFVEYSEAKTDIDSLYAKEA